MARQTTGWKKIFTMHTTKKDQYLGYIKTLLNLKEKDRQPKRKMSSKYRKGKLNGQ